MDDCDQCKICLYKWVKNILIYICNNNIKSNATVCSKARFFLP